MEKLLETDALADLLGIATATVRNCLSDSSHTLPPRVILPAAPSNPLWRPANVEAWIGALPLNTAHYLAAALPPAAPQPKRPYHRLPAP